MKRRLTILCVLPVLLAGCAGSNSPQAQPTSGPITPADPIQTQADLRILSEAELRKALLPVKALPTGFGVDPDSDGKETTRTSCDYKQPVKATTYVEGNFIKGARLSLQKS